MAVSCRLAIHLSRHVLSLDAKAWTEAQMRTTGVRKFRILELQSGRAVGEFRQSVKVLLHDADCDAWRVLPSRYISVHQRALCFASTARLAGSVFFYVVHPLAGFAGFLFKWLDSSTDFDAHAEVVYGMCPNVTTVSWRGLSNISDGGQRQGAQQRHHRHSFCDRARMEVQHATH